MNEKTEHDVAALEQITATLTDVRGHVDAHLADLLALSGAKARGLARQAARAAATKGRAAPEIPGLLTRQRAAETLAWRAQGERERVGVRRPREGDKAGVYGRVVDEYGRGLEGHKVVAHNAQRSVTIECKTAERGYFEVSPEALSALTEGDVKAVATRGVYLEVRDELDRVVYHDVVPVLANAPSYRELVSRPTAESRDEGAPP